ARKAADALRKHHVDLPRPAVGEQALKAVAVILRAGQRFVHIHAGIFPFGVTLDVFAVVADLRGQGMQHRIFAAGHAGIGRDAFAQRERWDIRFHFSYDLSHDSTSFTAIFALLPAYSKINLRSRG